MSQGDPFVVLGVSPDASESDIREAWRKKATTLHPDAGGSHQAMVDLNDALQRALAAVGENQPTQSHTRKDRSTPKSRSFMSRDVSCFTIDALPVDSWQLLYTSATHCGPIIEEEEPYLLEFMLSDTGVDALRDSMCRCEIVPEAGGSTIHLTVFSESGRVGNVEAVRDLLVHTINELGEESDA